MKNIILSLLICFILLSCKQSKPMIMSIEMKCDSQLVTFVTLDDTINFYLSDREQLLSIFQKADSLVNISDLKSSKIDTIGILDLYEFTYHQMYLDSSILYYIIISDTINNKNVYIDKFETFSDNILKYNGLYYY